MARPWGGRALDVAAIISGALLILIVADILLDGRLSAPLRQRRAGGGPGPAPEGDSDG